MQYKYNKAFGNILNYFLRFQSNIAILVAGSIITIYSAFGGIRAVTFTDILQFIAFGIGLPLIGILIWNQLYTIENFNLTNALQTTKFNFSEVLNYKSSSFWPMLVLLIYFTILGLEPVFFQRISMGKNIVQVKKAFLISSILLFLMILSIAWLPFLVFNLSTNLDTNHLLSYVVDNYTYPGLKGLIIIGVVAMAMSSADSFINIASVLFANDFCKPLNIGKNNELILSRLFACCLGLGTITLALIETDLLTIVLTANSFYMPIVTVPFMVAVFGFRTTKKSVLIAMSAGFITVIIWDILKIEVDCIIFAMLINFIFLIGSHYF